MLTATSGDQTQGLVCAIQAFYQWGSPPKTMFSLEFPDVLVYSAISLWIDTHPILNFLTKSARKKEERTKGPGDILVHVGEREGLPYIKRFFL